MSQHPVPTQANTSDGSGFRFDLVAGLTAAAVVLPKAMAYATVAGLPAAVAEFDQRLGRERLLFNARAVIERYQSRATAESNPQPSAKS